MQATLRDQLCLFKLLGMCTVDNWNPLTTGGNPVQSTLLTQY